VNDLFAGVIGSATYPPLAIRWFLPGKARVGWRLMATAGALSAFAWAAMVPFGPLVTDLVHDRVATPLPEEPLNAEVKTALLEAARAGAGARGAPPAGEIRHAHVGSTPAELMAALTGDFQSIEGDVGMTGETPVMRHDPRDPVGMTFLEWLEIVAPADFAIVKIDVKRDKVGPIIEDLRTAIRDYGLREDSLLINADVLKGPAAYGELNELEVLYNRAGLELEPQDLVEMADAFPQAAISIGLTTGRVAGGGGYRPADVDAVRDLATSLRAGGTTRVVVAARWDLLTLEFVEGVIDERIVIDVGNSLTILSPDNPDAEVERLRRRYGDGSERSISDEANADWTITSLSTERPARSS